MIKREYTGFMFFTDREMFVKTAEVFGIEVEAA